MFTEKELKKLTRLDLLELLAVQGRELEELRSEQSRLLDQVQRKRANLQNSGNLAEAALRVNGVYECMNQAMAQYLANVKRIAEPEVEEPKLEETEQEEAAPEINAET